jgi:hypothetical protein
MQSLLIGVLLLLTGCGPGLVFNSSQTMTPDEMLARASHVFVGVIEKHRFDSWPFFRLNAPGQDAGAPECWRILRREVRVELVVRGAVPRAVVDVYEIFWTCGATGDWNSTHDGERALFLVRVENGYYHVVRDWRRSIFPVTTGPHTRLPLDDAHPLWERIALMNWWIERGDETVRIVYPYLLRNDPGNALSFWRTVKLQRGLLRHPGPAVRIPVCRDLLRLGWGLDGCWEMLTENDRTQLLKSGCLGCSIEEIAKQRSQWQESGAWYWWSRCLARDERRLLTSISNRKMREEFCRLYAREYPGDNDNGCPADQPPPATIVTERGDVPLIGPWPK